MRQFYITYPILQSVIAKFKKITRTHFLQLLSIDDTNERSFYEIESIENNWSVRELIRQMNTALYERIILSKNKEGIQKLAKVGQIIEKPNDILKDPYFLEFLGISESEQYSESELEKAIIDNLGKFILELGKGFTFIGRQQRISNGADHWYIDLVLYNRLLRCFILIDLKIGKLKHQDIGQMQMYVNRYDREIKTEEENPTIGLILYKNNDKFVIEYTLPKGEKQIFARQYKLYLPDKKDLKKQLEEMI